ncbi:DUF1674 domain-containing protein [Lysobacter panacisoli]|uniref:DUF1674 domain-containing protein n=3 Tax=Lysobacter panacisoli TaxID=1255263 RepID=A0ABP9LB82_9GAMM
MAGQGENRVRRGLRVVMHGGRELTFSAVMIGQTTPVAAPEAPQTPEPPPSAGDTQAKEFGGREGPDPTRYGDWEKNGRCIDF